MFKCTRCDKSYETEAGLHIHVGTAHGRKKRVRQRKIAVRKPKQQGVRRLRYCPECGAHLEGIVLL